MKDYIKRKIPHDKKRIASHWLLFILLISSSLYLTSFKVSANVNSDLNNFFNGLGHNVNITAPHAYQGQQAGYYSGGSLFARSPVRNVQLVQVDLPKFSAGCGGIDLFAGGFSFINSDQLVSMMRNVMNNAKGYAFTLAMEEVTPQLANVMKYMQDMANKANQMNMNSCAIAESTVGGLWPKTRAATQQVCQDIGTSTGIFTDWARAHQGCTSSTTNEFNTTMQAGTNNPQYKNLILDNGNLAWKALLNNQLTTKDTQLAELLMSLSGSILITKDNNNGAHLQNLASLATNPALLKAILYGGDATVYHCDETTQCLHPQAATLTIAKDSALKNQIEKLLASISQKIILDQKLSTQEIGLLQATRIPIYKILAVQAAYQKDPNILNIDNYADVIAMDILFQYLRENLELVRTSASILQYPTDIMEQFVRGINQALNDVRVEEKNAQAQLSSSMQLIEQTQVIEQMLSGQLSAQLGNSLTWAKSLR